MSESKFKWMMIAICVVALSASCAYIFRNAYTTSKHTSTTHHRGVGEYCYIDSRNIVHLDLTCKKLNHISLTHKRVKPTELFDKGQRVESYCPACVDDEDYEVFKAISKLHQ